jgi:O-antigen/teichoic acid export membrane protein
MCTEPLEDRLLDKTSAENSGTAALVPKSATQYDIDAHSADDQLKRRSVRGGVIAVIAQGVKLVLQTVTMMLMARLLSAEDFGLQGMALVLIGFFQLFSEGGLGAATIQRLEITQAQISALFWVNLAVGCVLAALAAALAPVLVAFYGEPRLYGMTTVLGVSFVFSGLAAQHRALVLREMRFVTLAKVEVLSLATSSVVGVSMALLGCHYWSLVGMMLTVPLVSAVGFWLAVPWIPGLPRRGCGVLPMLHFGWMTTFNNVLVFLAWNADNILIGRVWGADALGLYGRAYNLATLPVHQLNAATSNVAFSALSRIQDDADRLGRSFLKGYALLLSLTVPITISCALFSDEIIRVMLGAKWMEAAPIFRLLTPTGLVFALVNPLALLVMSTGRMKRALSMTIAITPVVILGTVLGLSHGPLGVALGSSSAMILVTVPIAAWSIAGTGITWTDLWNAVRQPLMSGLLAGVVGLIVKVALGDMLTPILELLVGGGVIFGVYAWALLIVMGQKALYFNLLSQVMHRNPPNESWNR